MMICTTNDGSYATNMTGTCEPTQQFGGKADFMAAAKAYVAPCGGHDIGLAEILLRYIIRRGTTGLI